MVRSYGIIVVGPARAQQMIRRAELAELAGLRDVAVDAADAAPMGPTENGQTGLAEEPYRVALQAAITGTDAPVVLTGIGGDELLSLRPDERTQRATADSDDRGVLSREFDEAVQAPEARPGDVPASVVAESALLAHAVRAPTFLRAGRWPVSPLCDPELARFGEWLPREWRAGKRIALEWMVRERGARHALVRPELRENFAEVMQLGLRRYGLAHLHAMARGGSVLVDLGVIDADRLRAATSDAEDRAQRGDTIPAWLHEVVIADRVITRLVS